MSNIIAFWKPQDAYGFMSNWYHCNFTFRLEDPVFNFSNSEQYFMWRKALIFDDGEMAHKILYEKNPRIVQKLGRKIQNFDYKAWDAQKFHLMVETLKLKFGQNPALMAKLKATGNAILVEASPYDQIWGIGLAPNDPRTQNPNTWRGRNLLGQALMLVRDL